MGHGSSSQEVCEGTGVLNEGFLKILIISVDIIELLGVGCERNFDYWLYSCRRHNHHHPDVEESLLHNRRGLDAAPPVLNYHLPPSGQSATRVGGRQHHQP